MNRSHSAYEWAKNDAMSARRRTRLHDMTIDEVSLVDRAANQHANIAFSKADNQEDDMPEQVDLFDEDGFPVDVDDLEINDVVFDAEGNPGVIVPDEESDFEVSDEYELEPMGKSGNFVAGVKAGYGGWNPGKTLGRKGKLGAHLGRNRWRYGIGVPAAGGFGAAGVAGKKKYDERVEASKSLGDVVLDELSKAASEDERSEIIAAAMQEVEIAKAQAQEAMAYAEAAQDEQVTMAFISKAAEYNLPVAPEVLGPILKSASEVLTDEELDVLDQLFSGIGEYLYEELGVVGDTDNEDVYSQVDLAARELVGKADGSISPEMATTMMFENNPAAYEQYLAENGR